MTWIKGFQRLFVVLAIAWAVTAISILGVSRARAERSRARALYLVLARYDDAQGGGVHDSRPTYLDEKGNPIRTSTADQQFVEVDKFGVVAFPSEMTPAEMAAFLRPKFPSGRSPDVFDRVALEREARQWFVANRQVQLSSAERDSSVLRQLILAFAPQNCAYTVGLLVVPPLLLWLGVSTVWFIGRWIVAGFGTADM